MIEAEPLTIAGQTLTLKLDLRAMYEAERACPGLKLLSLDSEEGWTRVAEEIGPFLAVLYGCLWEHRTGRSITDPVDDAYLAWLAESLTPTDITDLQTKITRLFLEAIVGGVGAEEVEAAAGNPHEAEPAAASSGSTSGHSPDSSSDSLTLSSGDSPSVSSTTLPPASNSDTTSTTSAPDYFQQ